MSKKKNIITRQTWDELNSIEGTVPALRQQYQMAPRRKCDKCTSVHKECICIYEPKSKKEEKNRKFSENLKLPLARIQNTEQTQYR